MKILLVNPPNSGRSIPEEEHGIDSIKQIFRGEPLCLEVLAGNLAEFQTRILDLKVEGEDFEKTLAEFNPDIVGLTAMTCEAQTAARLARRAKEIKPGIRTAIGGVHASNDPEFFNRPEIDYIVIGLGKASFRALVLALDTNDNTAAIPGVARSCSNGEPLCFTPRKFSSADLAEENPPRYDLVERHRDEYALRLLGLNMGFVATAFGCPHDCDFCSIAPLTGGRYLTHSPASVTRDIRLLGDTPIIRLVDANTFGNPREAFALADVIERAGIRKQYLADVRSDTVVRHPELFRRWKEIGLRAVVIGFEEISDERLGRMNKRNRAANTPRALDILREAGVGVVGDFIVSPDYGPKDFEALARFVRRQEIGLPMFTILTPLPGTGLYEKMKKEIVVSDLDYYTLTNAVTPTRLPEAEFYAHFADLLREFHKSASL